MNIKTSILNKIIPDKRYLCYQQIVKEVTHSEGVRSVQMEVIVRNVGAKNEEEALGKFILETSKIKAKEKLNPIAFRLDFLMKIN